MTSTRVPKSPAVTTQRGSNEALVEEALGMRQGEVDIAPLTIRHEDRGGNVEEGATLRHSLCLATSPDAKATTPTTTPPPLRLSTTRTGPLFGSTTATYNFVMPAPDSTTVLSPRCMNSSIPLATAGPVESSACHRRADRGRFPDGMLDELGPAQSSSNPSSFSPSNMQVAFASSLESNSSLEEAYFGLRNTYQKENQQQLSLPRLSSSSSSALVPLVLKLGQRKEAPPMGASEEDYEDQGEEEEEIETTVDVETSAGQEGEEGIDCKNAFDCSNHVCDNGDDINDGVEMIYGVDVVNSKDVCDHDDRIGVAVVWKDSSLGLDMRDEDISDEEDEEDSKSSHDDEEFFLANPATLQEEKRWEKKSSRRVVLSTFATEADHHGDQELDFNLRRVGYAEDWYEEVSWGSGMRRRNDPDAEEKMTFAPCDRNELLQPPQPTNKNATNTIRPEVTSRLGKLSLCPRPPPPMASCIPPPTRRAMRSRNYTSGSIRDGSVGGRKGRVIASSLYPFVSTKNHRRSTAGRGGRDEPMVHADLENSQSRNDTVNDGDELLRSNVKSPDSLLHFQDCNKKDRREDEGNAGITALKNPIWKTPRSAPSTMSDPLSPLHKEGRGPLGVEEEEDLQGTPSSLPLLRRDQSVLGAVASSAFLTMQNEGCSKVDDMLSSPHTVGPNDNNAMQDIIVKAPRRHTYCCCDDEDDDLTMNDMSPRPHKLIPSPCEVFGKPGEFASKQQHLGDIGSEAPNGAEQCFPMKRATKEHDHESPCAVRPPPHFLQPRGSTASSYDSKKTDSANCAKSGRKRKEEALSPTISGA